MIFKMEYSMINLNITIADRREDQVQEFVY